MRNVFFHSGDIGDILASLPAIRQLGGGAIVVGPHEGGGAPREPMTQQRCDFLFPLLQSQTFITTVKHGPKPKTTTHDFSMFRVATRGIQGESLAHWQARHVGVNDLDVSPWLSARPDPRSSGAVCIARSPRYHNARFPWKSLVPPGDGVIFLGLNEEREALEGVLGRALPHYKLASMKEMAELVAGSRLFIGNQSAPCWLAMGLGHNMIQESFAAAPNSCIPRDNARFIQ